jgi:acyl-coenzyme A thioesterase PaaI-like protein
MTGTRDYPMATIDSVLRRGLDGTSPRFTLTLDPAFQGLPDTAHGGSVLALFDALAGLAGPREVTGTYRRRVPLGTPLDLATSRAGAGLACAVRDASGALLVDGGVAPPAARDGAPDRAGPPAVGDAGAAHPLPISRTCFACGTENPLGLGARLRFDDAAVGGTWEPRAAFRRPDGTLAPAALTTLLDEAAFWLGALATGESGMTTALRVTLHRPVALGEPITVAGARARVHVRPDDARYWDTEVEARGADGGRVASARITFVAVRGAARRLVTGMLAVNEPALVARVFPAYAR